MIYFLHRKHCHLESQNETNASLPPAPPIVQSQAPLLTCGSCWTAGQRHMASTAAHTAGSLTHTPHTQCFMSQLELTVSSTGILERIMNFTVPKSFI